MSKITKVLFMFVFALGISACVTPPMEVEKVAACVFPDSARRGSPVGVRWPR